MTPARTRLSIVGAATSAFLFVVGANPAPAQVVYGVTGAGGSNSSLYTIDPTTGAATLVNAVTLGGSGISLTGITYDSANGLLYGIQSSSNSNLVTINSTTGVATLVGSLGGGVGAQSIAYDSTTNALYAYSKSPTPEGLYTLSTTNGAATRVDPTGSRLSGTTGIGLGIDGSGNIYLAPNTAQGSLDTMSPSTGQVLGSVAFSGAPLASSQMKALAFDSSGNMYGLDFVPGSPFTTNLVSIDPSTGAITNIGSTQNGLDGFAFVPVAVPEPGSFILVGLVASGFLLCRWVKRRRCRIAAAGC